MIAAAAHGEASGAFYSFIAFVAGTAVVATCGYVVAKVRGASTKIKEWGANVERIMIALFGEEASKWNRKPDPGLMATVTEHSDTFVKNAAAMAQQDERLETLQVGMTALLTDATVNGSEPARDALDRIDHETLEQGEP